MNFPELYGHEEIKKSLGLAITQDRISNAYVFEGPDGVGKKLCAKIFSQALVCEELSAPCGKCPMCIQAKAKTLPDIITVQKDSDKTQISIDNIRQQVIAEAPLKPRNAKRKIFIVNEGDLLNEAAQNALLKVLEEPPSYVTFILCVTSKEKLLPTVLSRSQIISFFPLAAEIVETYLLENTTLSPEDAKITAKLAQGSIGTALALATDNSKKERIASSISHLISLRKNALRIRETTEFLSEEKENITEIIDYMLTFLRDCVMVKTDLEQNVVFLDRVSDMRIFTQNITKKQLLLAFDKLNNVKLLLKQNLNFNATVSEAVMRVWEVFHD